MLFYWCGILKMPEECVYFSRCGKRSPCRPQREKCFFNDEQRLFYHLERIWGDGEKYDEKEEKSE